MVTGGVVSGLLSGDGVGMDALLTACGEGESGDVAADDGDVDLLVGSHFGGIRAGDLGQVRWRRSELTAEELWLMAMECHYGKC